jgi:hypothetical protein
MGEAAILTGAELVKAGRKIVTLQSGQTVEIQRVSLATLAEVRGALPDLTVLVKSAEAGTEAGLDLDALAKVQPKIERILIDGLVNPRLYRDAAFGPTPRDLPWLDQITVFGEIMSLCGQTIKAAEEVLPLSGTEH